MVDRQDQTCQVDQMTGVRGMSMLLGNVLYVWGKQGGVMLSVQKEGRRHVRLME